jgi:hypothetical protein
MDETDVPQSPPELLVILALIADEKILIQTIADQSSPGCFNKGVDYGASIRFAEEFEADIAVFCPRVKHYGLPANLKN